MARVLLADDHRLFTDLVEVILRDDGHDVLAAAPSAQAAIERVSLERPTICLVDPVALAPADPHGLVASLSRTGATRVVVLTGEPAAVSAAGAMTAGAAGGMSKSVSSRVLLDALHRVEAGESVWVADDGGAVTQLARLGPRERECLQLLAAGCSTTQIAAAMDVSPATVRSHVRSVLGKLGVHSRLAAASFAIRHGVTGVSPSPAAERSGYASATG